MRTLIRAEEGTMPTQVLVLDPDDGAGLFDLDIKVDFDSTTLTDVFSSVACGWSECGTGSTCSTCHCSDTCPYHGC
jgi:hypothetical protein